MITLEHFKVFVDEINSSNSRLHKQAVLKKYSEDEIIKKYLQIAFDPYMVYGISTKKLNKELDLGNYMVQASIFDLFDYLEAHNTGTTEDIIKCKRFTEHVDKQNSECTELLKALICKDLSIGCDSKTINKEIPGLIPTFDVQLANKYFDKPQYVEGKTFAITTKIDGGRIIALKENGKVSFFTRAGQKYEGLVDLEDEMSRMMPDNICLDGEITLLDKGDLTSKEQYKETMKIVRTKDPEKHGIKMLVFDWMPAEDFKKQNCALQYNVRRISLSRIFCSHSYKYFELLPLLYAGDDTSRIPEILNEQIANGEEGIMINIYDAPYEFKRTNNLLKVKKMNDIDLEIIGFEEGAGRLVGTLGAIIVRYKNNNTVKVGSGFSDEQRKEIWEHQSDWLGAVCAIQYFETSVNSTTELESLRFPVFIERRVDKVDADY